MARPAILRAAIVSLAGAALAWSLGGQAMLGRIDPALLLPLLPLPLLMLAWLQRREAVGVRMRGLALTLVLLAALQIAIAWLLAGRAGWAQPALIVIAGALGGLVSDALVVRLRSRWARVLLVPVFVAGWFAGGHGLLAVLYRAPAVSGPPVTMLTGLPLRWSGGNDITAMIAAGTNDDPALARIEAAGPVRLVDSLVDNPPPAGGTLLLAHPYALAPRELVAIDAFVRGGGHAVILADALSGWPARHPLGDTRNPPMTSLLTPLLDHWGVTLAAAPAGDTRPVDVEVDGARLRLFSAGAFTRLPATCRAIAGRRIARCRVGEGETWLVGDADMVFAPLWQPDPAWAGHLRHADTMEWLAGRLWPGAPRAALQPIWIRRAAR